MKNKCNIWKGRSDLKKISLTLLYTNIPPVLIKHSYNKDLKNVM